MKNNYPLVSVIVPVYQVEPYLRECIDSILSQNFRNFELILIDDGSKDNCGQICDEYEKKDERIRVIHQKNQGLSAARNAGIDIAEGEYLTMVDSDDILLSKDYIRFLYEAIVRNNAQISMCGLVGFTYEEEKIDIIDEPTDFLVCPGNEYWSHPRYPGFYEGCAYAKMYHRELFKNVRYPVGHNVEDQAVIHRLVYPCNKIVIIDLKMYGYRLRTDGIMGNADKTKMIQDIIYAFEDRRAYFIEHGRDDLARLAEKTMLAHLMPFQKES